MKLLNLEFICLCLVLVLVAFANCESYQSTRRKSVIAAAKAIDIQAVVFSQMHDMIQNTFHSNSNINCSIPKQAIILTYSTHYMMDMIETQRKSLAINGISKCLNQHFVLVCLDKRCRKICEENEFKLCVTVDLNSVKHGRLLHDDFKFISYFKHQLIFEALKVANEVFFIDTDSLLLRNPWVELHKTISSHPGGYDMLYELGPWDSPTPGRCGEVTTGQMYVKVGNVNTCRDLFVLPRIVCCIFHRFATLALLFVSV